MKKLSSLAAGLFLTISAAFAQNSDVMLQGFDAVSYQNTNGWYNVVNSKAAELKAAGFNAIWMPPPSSSTGGMGYLPKDYYNLNTSHGSAAQLSTLIGSLHGQGIKVIADIVINHRVGQNNWADFYNPSWGPWAVCKDDEWANNGGNPTGNYDTGEKYEAGRDLDHTNVTVQNDIKAWMYWLKNTIGFDGWRYDLVKGYSPYYVGMYNDATAPYISIGEYFDGNRQLVQNWVDGTSQKSAAFDFPLKFTLANAVNGNYGILNSGGAEPGLAGWSPTKAVTFIDNHDTYGTYNAFPGDNGKLLQGYAYILTHPGIPMVFWDHYSDWGTATQDAIKAMIKIRKDNGVSAGSSLSIQAAQSDLYAAIVNGNVAMKIGPASWSPSGAGWYLKNFGTNYAIWDRIAPCAVPTLTVTPGGPASGTAPFAVTASATSSTGTPTPYYTTDGTTPSTSSASAAGSKAFSFNTNTTLKVFAQVSNCSTAVQSHSYTVTAPPSDGFSVFFQKPAGWSSAKIYYWNTAGGSMPAVTWPGVAMTAYSGGWYKFSFPGVSSTNLIFTDGTNQTADLSRNKTGSYSSNAWSDSRPAITYTMDGALDASATKIADANGIQLYADYNGSKLYVAAKSATGTVNDVFLFVGSTLGAATAAPWAKAGTVPGGCAFIGNESSNNWAGWTGATTTTISAGTFVEGTLDVGASFGTAANLYLSSAKYGTADGGTLQAQTPAAVTANGNLEANEFVKLILSAF